MDAHPKVAFVKTRWIEVKSLRNRCVTHNSERVGRRRTPLQLGPALAPALTRCLSAARLRQRASRQPAFNGHRSSRVHRESSPFQSRQTYLQTPCPLGHPDMGCE